MIGGCVKSYVVMVGRCVKKSYVGRKENLSYYLSYDPLTLSINFYRISIIKFNQSYG